MEGTALAEHFERLADWAVGGAAVVCALIALRAASHGSWLLRLILGPVAVGGVLAAFYAVLVLRTPVELRGAAQWPGAAAASREAGAVEPRTVATAPEARTDEPAAPVEPVARPASAPSAAPADAVAETQRPLLYFATDRASADPDGGTTFASTAAGRLEVGRVLPGRPHRSAMAQSRSVAASDADGGGHPARAEPFRLETLTAAAWGEELARQAPGEGGAAERRAVVVVHGYDTSFDDAVRRASRLAKRMQPGPPVVLFSWPSGARVASYSRERESAQRSAAFLAETLQALASGGGIRSLSLVCDGLGCRVLLEALDKLASAPASGASLADIVLSAPDVDAAELARRVPVLAAFARGIALYADAADRGLDVSRRFNAGVLPAGGVAESGPLVLPGMTTIDATGTAEGDVAEDMARLLAAGDRDPAARGLQPVRRDGADGQQVHWRLEGRR